MICGRMRKQSTRQGSPLYIKKKHGKKKNPIAHCSENLTLTKKYITRSKLTLMANTFLYRPNK